MNHRRAALSVSVFIVLLSLVPETRATTETVTGYASAYAPGRMAEVVRWRLDNDVWRTPPPRNWYEVAGYIATNDCAQVGQTMTLIDPAGRAYRVLVADCGGPGDGVGASWMTRNRIIAELDWRLWETLTAAHGRPLEIELR